MTFRIHFLPPPDRHRLALYAAEMRAVLAGAAVATPEAQAALLAAHPAAEVLLAEDAGAAPLGFAILFDLPEVVFARRCGMLDDLFVRPQSRGQGLARALIEAAVAAGRARGWSHLRWIVPEQDAAAIALYQRIATAPTGAATSSGSTQRRRSELAERLQQVLDPRRIQRPHAGHAAQQQRQPRGFLQLLRRMHRIGQRRAAHHRPVIGQQQRLRVA